MDFSDYFKKNRARQAKNDYRLERKCLACGQACQNKGSHLHAQSFCCQECKDIYVHSND